MKTIVKRTFALFVFVFTFVATSFAQSLATTEFITYKVPLHEKLYWPKHSDWATLYYTTDGNWIVTDNGVWCVLSNNGTKLDIYNERPNFEDICKYKLSIEDYVKLEDRLWDFDDKPQIKKFRYTFETDDVQTYLIITVKKNV